METYQKLKIFLEEDKKDHFFKDIINDLNNSSWKIRNDLVENYKKNTFTKEKRILCAESEKYLFGNKTISGLLWMWDYSGYFEVFNIIPVETGMLEFKEYNYILNQFIKLFVNKELEKYGGQVDISAPIKRIIDTIGQEAFDALKAFSFSANKATGHSNSYDFERWCEFVFIVFKNETQLSVDELIVWLEENGWTNDMATKLGLDFEYSIDLLERYERN
jgi:hypothetical protein